MTKRKIPFAWEIVVWLWLAYFMNQADRQLYSVVQKQVQDALGLSDIQTGLVNTVLIASMAVMMPIAGFVGDRFSRRRIILWSLLAWSVATMLTGFTNGLVSLIVVRSLATAVGEAFFLPAATALIGQYHVKTRGQALAIYQTAQYFGAVSCGWVGGWIAGNYGWKHSFWIFGGAGVVLVALMWSRLKDAPKTAVAVAREPISAVLGALFRTPTALVLTLALGCSTFVNMGCLAWMPTYLQLEPFSLTPAKAGLFSMLYYQIFSFVGVLLGGRVSDKIVGNRPSFRIELSGLALLLCVPTLYLMGATHSLWLVYAMLGAFGFFRGLYDSNIYASLFDVTSPRHHASATGMMAGFSFGVGSLAPLILGVIKQSYALNIGISMLGIVYVFGSLALLVTARAFFPSDYARNRQPLPSADNNK
ncbi:MFS family permease [Ereboglobus sp. PH5-10]|uniref:MFS transporter n=1 Tax=Ereboglobus sp. PH5-10 TaxID=2940629 RepID=UPI0024072588|nr:MFS transporter [Ereboglobus sp. PH5-10]MDF9826166.1 MFS family permease [Ereboglobus sp. PH5-10]